MTDMLKYLFHALKVVAVGLALAYLATHYLLEPISEQVKTGAVYILLVVVLLELFGNKLKRLSP